MRKLLGAVALGIVLVFPNAWAQVQEPHPFFHPADLDLAKLLPPPPAAGSLEAQADLEAVLQAQEWRTKEEADWARFVDSGFFNTYDMRVLGPGFNEHDFPLCCAMLRELHADEHALSDIAKNFFHRDRPFRADSRVHPCVPPTKGGSYPSGHSQGAYLWAAFLSEVFPEHAAELEAQAHRVAWGRVLGGVHYPSDLIGGRILAGAVMKKLMENPEFREELERCRAEAERFRAKKAAGRRQLRAWPARSAP